MATKICSKCKISQPLDRFCRAAKSFDGKQSWCKSCKVSSVRTWESKNPEVARESSRKRLSKWMKTERGRAYNRGKHHKNKLARNISRRMRQSLGNARKSRTWEELVDFSLEKLRNHLEAKFRDGMNWENYGKLWEIDHVVPVREFKIDGDSCESFKQCWSLENLQPLLKVENKRKG